MEPFQLLGDLVVAELVKLPRLAALAIVFETGQGAPAFYLAHETVEHAQQRLIEYADQKVRETKEHLERLKSEGAQPEIDRIENDLTALPYLHRSFIGDHCNGLLETGHWINPASPVLFEVNADIDEWAIKAFAALLGEHTEDEWTQRYQHLTGTFWAAIDHARRTAAEWPPIAFVASFDDNSGDLPFAIITRHIRQM